jgi:hypothetical protein
LEWTNIISHQFSSPPSVTAIEAAENSVIAAAIQDTKDPHVNPQLVLVSS